MFFDQTHKGQWKIDFEHPELKPSTDEFTVEYEIYCHELTVRTSHIDESHAFIHGPSVFMGVMGHEMLNPTLEIEFPALWSKVSTGLKDISEKREIFKYEAPDYDLFIDAPIEIGCHETDGFMAHGKPHELAFYGPTIKHPHNLKKDMQTIVEYTAELMGEFLTKTNTLSSPIFFQVNLVDLSIVIPQHSISTVSNSMSVKAIFVGLN